MLFLGILKQKEKGEDARACVEMALKMQERMHELRESG